MGLDEAAKAPNVPRLADLPVGTRGTIAEVPLDDAALAAELAALRILPGERIEVLEGIPYGGPVVIQTAGGTYALGRRLAGRITVRGQP